MPGKHGDAKFTCRSQELEYRVFRMECEHMIFQAEAPLSTDTEPQALNTTGVEERV